MEYSNILGQSSTEKRRVRFGLRATAAIDFFWADRLCAYSYGSDYDPAA